jgi:hypothetical protein
METCAISTKLRAAYFVFAAIALSDSEESREIV